MPPTRLSLCLIARDAAPGVARLIESLRSGLAQIDEVVIVDTGAGESAQAAAAALQGAGYGGAVVLGACGPSDQPDWFLPGGVCDTCAGWGQGIDGEVCPTCYGSKLDPAKPPLLVDFARARQHAFDLATGSWRGWLDADDEVSHGDLFAQAPLGVEDSVDCIVMPYLYAGVDGGRPVIQTRERWVRWRDGNLWRWEGRVHEVLQRQSPGGAETVQQIAKPLIAHRGDPVARESATRARNRILLHTEIGDASIDEHRRQRARAYLAFDAALDGRIETAAGGLALVRARREDNQAVPVEMIDRAAALVQQARRAAPVRSVAILAVGSPLAWHARSTEEGGCGGSEEAVIYVARELAARGIEVRVYGAAREEAHTGVLWAPGGAWASAQAADLVLGWRSALSRRAMSIGQRAILWAHDVHVGRCDRDDLASFEAIWTLSAYQEGLLREAYPGAYLPPFWRLGNALPASAWEAPHTAPRDDRKVVYVSSPDRGLDRLLDLWPEVREAVPGAILNIFYGWDTFDAAWGAAEDGPEKRAALAYKARVVAQAALLKLGGVTWRGRVSQPVLAREMAAAGVLAYPSSFDEVFCISAARAEAAGLAIVATATGSLPEVVTWPDALVPLPWGDAARAEFTERLIDALRNPPGAADREALSKAARRWTWARAVDGLLVRLRG